MTKPCQFRTETTWRRVRAVIAVVALGALAGCAVPSGSTANRDHDREVSDPLEGLNRTIFGINEVLDLLFIGPAAHVYQDAVPPPVRTSVRGVLNNLASPVVAANQLLQGDLDGALTTAQRFVINSTIGIGGIADIAAMNGLKHRNEDFGQTLGVWGIGEGPYLVLPLLGPSNLRDALGLGVDTLADPSRIYAQARDLDTLQVVRNGVNIIDRRTNYLAAIRDMRHNSLDYYASMRSAYQQRRDNEIADRGTTALPAKATPSATPAPSSGDSSGAAANLNKAAPEGVKASAGPGAQKAHLKHKNKKYKSRKMRSGKPKQVPAH